VVTNKAMMMQPRDLVLAVIGQCSSRPEFGRTSLQKVAYLVSLVLDVDLGHSAYYYGPYSSTVEADAEALVMGGLVSETVEPLGFSGRGFPVNKFHYSITNTGQDRLARIKSAYPDQMTRLEEFVQRVISVVGSLEQANLSAAAKTLYIAREQGKAVSLDEVKALASDFGWKLSKPTIVRVAEMLSQLSFVKVDRS
jgi:uncharacterized protein YwgA